MTFRIGLDVGGTFTDAAIIDEETGEFQSFKFPTTRDPIDGVIECCRIAATGYGIDMRKLFLHTSHIIHGTTVATNTVIQRKGVKTGLLCTMGHNHILWKGEANKEDVFNHKIPFPETLIPVYLCQEVKERMNSEGEIVVPLDEESVLAAIQKFKKWKVEAIAVSLLWSIVNGKHERVTKEIIEREWPGISPSISSEVEPTIREYPRTCCVVLDAMLKPIITDYIKNFDNRLRENGFRGEWYTVTSSGGLVTPSELSLKPVYTLYSGPSIGPLAGLFFATGKQVENIVIIDMGGTSFDVSTVIEGMIPMTKNARIGPYPTGLTSIEVLTIGAGGGSIGWVDPGGLLHVGPQSAGAHPGPACYATGGKEPTVTDANLVLGYLNPNYFLGGQMKINPKLSWNAIEEKVARPIKQGVEQAAVGIHRVVNENMVAGILEMTVRRGIDPREFLLIGGGGAAALHAARLARELGIRKILIPKGAPVLCAIGMLNGDISFSFSASNYTQTNQFNFESVNVLLAELEEKARTFLIRSETSHMKIRFEYYVTARYPMQVSELEIPLAQSRVTPEMILQLERDFHNTYEKRYGICDRKSHIELVDWRVVGIGHLSKIALQEKQLGGKDPSNAFKGRRRAYFEEDGQFIETPLYDGNKLVCGMEIDGPAIVEDALTSTLVIPGSVFRVDEFGSYVVELS
ncbi:MAG: hydantoinase/oxoprolinase family protein [Candidatus Hodarchaeota archaeon]